jgi:hypothetical protein
MGFAGCGRTEAERTKLFCFFFLEKRSACWPSSAPVSPGLRPSGAYEIPIPCLPAVNGFPMPQSRSWRHPKTGGVSMIDFCFLVACVGGLLICLAYAHFCEAL